MRLIDTNVLIRLIAQDQPRMTAASVALFEVIENEDEQVLLLDAAVAEVVFVLTSRNLYGMSRDDVGQRLRYVLELQNVLVENKARCLRAFEVWMQHRQLSYVDAYIAVATLEQELPEVYSFDRDFDRIEGITRIEPAAPW